MSIQTLLPELERQTDQPLASAKISPVGGGCINSAYRLQTDAIDWFIKTNRASLASMFAAEAQGLQEMAALDAITVPAVIACGQSDESAYLVLEYIPLHSLDRKAARLMGEQLAELHRPPQDYFGWCMDNTIGSTPQHNQRQHDWVEFWRHQRLLKQLEFAANNGYRGKLQQRGELLAERLPAFFSDYQPFPSLLHGDLWGGNASATGQGQPVIYDPACYYGDREADIAMTELFGGFGPDFHAAYQQALPLDAGYQTRKTLYNLYHILNHLNLFGGGYLHQAESMIESLLAHC